MSWTAKYARFEDKDKTIYAKIVTQTDNLAFLIRQCDGANDYVPRAVLAVSKIIDNGMIRYERLVFGENKNLAISKASKVEWITEDEFNIELKKSKDGNASYNI